MELYSPLFHKKCSSQCDRLIPVFFCQAFSNTTHGVIFSCPFAGFYFQYLSQRRQCRNTIWVWLDPIHRQNFYKHFHNERKFTQTLPFLLPSDMWRLPIIATWSVSISDASPSSVSLFTFAIWVLIFILLQSMYALAIISQFVTTTGHGPAPAPMTKPVVVPVWVTTSFVLYS